MNIKAIPTRYKGYNFRSRTEARWAVFFDALGLAWEYEPQGFFTEDGTGYLPDFWVPELKAIVEIKARAEGDQADQPWLEDGSKERKFADLVNENHGAELPPPYTGALFVVLFGLPGAAGHWLDEPRSYAGTVGWDSPYFLCECPHCGALGFQFDGRDGRNNHKRNCPAIGKHDKGAYNIDSSRILSAASVARAARFEHGETPT